MADIKLDGLSKQADEISKAPSAKSDSAKANQRTKQAADLAKSRPGEPAGGFNFRIEIEGIDCGGFKSVDGLSAEIEEIEHQTGMDPYPLKRPGRKKFGNIKLSKGYLANVALWQWFEDALKGKVSRKSGSVILLDDAGTERVRYNFFNAWPKSWSGFKLDGKGTDISVEDIELVIESLEVKTA